MNFETGVYTVIPTFFKDRVVDTESIFKIIRFQIENNVKNIVLLGTTSETPTLTKEEKVDIVNTVWEEFNDKINIIVGIGTNDTKTTLENGFLFRDVCHAFMITVPYYNKPSQEGIYQHFATVAQLIADKPIMMYNIPSRCGVSIEPKIIANLFNSFENIVAIKEASGSIQQTLEINNLCDIVILSGDDALTLPLMSVGAKGVVSVASNIIPQKIVTLVSLYNTGHVELAYKLNKSLYSLFKGLFIDTNPIPLKYFSKEMGLSIEDSVRLPLVCSSDTNIVSTLKAILNQLQLTDGKKIDLGK